MKHLALFGNIEFGDFLKDGAKDHFPCAIVREIQCQLMIDEEEADDFMTENSYGGYLMPDIFKGEIYFAGLKDAKLFRL